MRSRVSIVVSLVALALLAGACDRLDPRRPVAAAVVEPGASATPERQAANEPDAEEDPDVADPDVWPPGPGPEAAVGATAANEPDTDEDADVADPDVWPPGPGPDPEGR